MYRWNDMYPEELFHYGTKGRSGRWPWGSGERPYQRLKKGVGRAKSAITNPKRKKEAAKRQAEEAERQRHIANKENVIRSGSARDVLKYQGELTNSELQTAATRLRLENEIKGYAKKEVQSNMQKIDKALKNLQTVRDFAKVGTELYNQMADAYNSTEEGRRNPLHRINNSGGGGGNR